MNFKPNKWNFALGGLGLIIGLYLVFMQLANSGPYNDIILMVVLYAGVPLIFGYLIGSLFAKK